MSPPDFLNLVVGTAGHIDHGKSSLVERLTGHHPDTLKEERNRGLTINLGYATFQLDDGRKVGIIDVPGHEKFIKNMVAGATGIQFVILVIAADDSIMPQTREHLDILRILGVKRGLVALTKVDTVDEETVEIATEEIRDFVAGTFLEGAPVLPVSSITGDGFDALRAEIERSLADVKVHHRELPFRMPVQRVFTASGHGTVATGVPVSGAVDTGESLEILPGGTMTRLRGLQAYGGAIDRASAGHRAALNLADVDYQAISRGIVAAAPGLYSDSQNLEVRLEYSESNAKPLKHLSSIRFHAGTAETVGRVSLLDRKAIEPGDSCFAQLFLQDPVAVAEGDRYILRAISPMITLGGGVIIGSSEVRHRRFRDWTLQHLARKEAAIEGGAKDYLAEVVYGQGRRPVAVDELPRHVHRTAGELRPLIDELVAEGRLVSLGGGRGVMHAEILEQLHKELAAQVTSLHEQHKQSLYVPLREVLHRMNLDRKFLEQVVAVLEERGQVRRGADGRIGLPSFAPDLTPRQKELHGKIEGLFLERGIAPPRRDEVGEETGGGKDETGRLLALLLDEGTLVKLKDDRIFHRQAVEGARDALVGALREHGQLTAAEIKNHVDTSRKNLIPLLEHFDQSGITVRKGDYRSLAPEGVDAR